MEGSEVKGLTTLKEALKLMNGLEIKINANIWCRICSWRLKGIKNKNLQILGGDSLTKRALKDLVNCSIIDSIFLSSDSEKILSEADSFSSVSKIKRPHFLLLIIQMN